MQLAGFFVVLKFLHLPSDASLAELETAGQDFCDTPWGAVNLSRGKEIHVDRYCFRCKYRQHVLIPPPPLPAPTGSAVLLDCCCFRLYVVAVCTLTSSHPNPPPTPHSPHPLILLFKFGCVWLLMHVVVLFAV